MLDGKKTGSEAGRALHALIESIRDREERLYAVVDSARDRDLASSAFHNFYLNRESLFVNAAPHMNDVAPYVVAMEYRGTYPYAHSGYLDLWAERLGGAAGFLLLSTAGPGRVVRHLRGLFEVEDEDRRSFYFRYYDPRVLRVYLPTCTGEEAKEFFGPIGTILVEGETPGSLLLFEPGPRGVRCEERNP